MSELKNQLLKMRLDAGTEKRQLIDDIGKLFTENGYEIVEVNYERPWGGYLRFNNKHAKEFIGEFFKKLNAKGLLADDRTIELSPKVLVVAPGQKISWQYHNRRSECWTFLTKGFIERNLTDTETDPIGVHLSDEVFFSKSERHRAMAPKENYLIILEIWQHLDLNNISDENDIVRLADDYSR